MTARALEGRPSWDTAAPASVLVTGQGSKFELVLWDLLHDLGVLAFLTPLVGLASRRTAAAAIPRRWNSTQYDLPMRSPSSGEKHRESWRAWP